LLPCGYVMGVHEALVAGIPGLKSETWGTLRCLQLQNRPMQMLGGRGKVVLIATDEKYDLPNSKAAALDAGLPPRSRIAEIDQGKLGSAHRL
jgi:hypothetical protein